MQKTLLQPTSLASSVAEWPLFAKAKAASVETLRDLLRTKALEMAPRPLISKVVSIVPYCRGLWWVHTLVVVLTVMSLAYITTSAVVFFPGAWREHFVFGLGVTRKKRVRLLLEFILFVHGQA